MSQGADWSRPFDGPIALPDGRVLKRLLTPALRGCIKITAFQHGEPLRAEVLLPIFFARLDAHRAVAVQH